MAFISARCFEKSILPRFFCVSSALSLKAKASSPINIGMPLIANAIIFNILNQTSLLKLLCLQSYNFISNLPNIYIFRCPTLILGASEGQVPDPLRGPPVCVAKWRTLILGILFKFAVEAIPHQPSRLYLTCHRDYTSLAVEAMPHRTSRLCLMKRRGQRLRDCSTRCPDTPVSSRS